MTILKLQFLHNNKHLLFIVAVRQHERAKAENIFQNYLTFPSWTIISSVSASMPILFYFTYAFIISFRLLTSKAMGCINFVSATRPPSKADTAAISAAFSSLSPPPYTTGSSAPKASRHTFLI